MKIIIFEADKEELAANRRVADTIVDALTNFLDSFTRLDAFSNSDSDSDINNNEDNEDNEEE